MNFIFQMPLEARMAVLFFLGLLIGGQINRGIYRLAWDPRRIGPWSPPHEKAPPRRWYDRIPVVGWLGLRRESPLHGAGYWVRPMLIELACGAGFAALYWWEMTGHLAPPIAGMIQQGPADLHAQVVSHLILISLMMVATFIDIDEKTIPDAITIPGTIVALILAAMLPTSLLPVELIGGGARVEFLTVTTPLPWPTWLNGAAGLVLGLLCFAFWCFAVTPKTWFTRRGPVKAVRYLLASMVRHPSALRFLLLLLAGCVAIAALWWSGEIYWQGLFSSLAGMTFGAALVWAVRVIGSRVLDKEAMGFGDVTLMAMIGAYVGWQPTLIVFFLAPFAGVVIAVGQWVITGRKDIFFGPFLCLAAAILLVFWSPLWAKYGEVFFLGWYIPAVLIVCLGLMAGMLGVWRFISDWLWGK